MTTKEARAIIAGGLKFGDPELIRAVDLIEKVENSKSTQNGLACTQCGEGFFTDDRALKRHRIGCFLCAGCAAQIDTHLDRDKSVSATQEPGESAGSLSDQEEDGRG